MKRKLKETGYILELELASECMKRNAKVSVPVGDSAHYDLLVDNGSQIFKVQVKTASIDRKYRHKFWINSQRKLPTNCSDGPTSRSKAYEKEEIDVLASKADGIWFFFDKCHSLPSSLTVYPHRDRSSRKWNFGKDDWSLLGLEAGMPKTGTIES